MTTARLTASEARALRLASLRLAASDGVPPASTVGDLARWFGAMQGQDLASLQWSLGVRLPGATLADVEAALERREALRTWPMRGTIHLVPPEDAAWMVRILGEKPLAGAAKRREFLGLDAKEADRAVEVLESALSGGRRLTRAECVATLEEAGISGAGQRGYHLLWYASQHGVTCIGPNVGKEQTFVLLRDWAPEQHDPTRDEALALIALRYFQSHGPAPRKDFAGWAGITVAEAKKGIAGCGDALVTVDVEGVEMLMAAAVLDAGAAELGRGDVLALPGFDEFVLGYKDRSLVIDPAHMTAIIPGGNGVFRSTIVQAGRVIATWKRTLTAKLARVEVLPLAAVRKADRRPVEASLQRFAAFHGRELEVLWP